MALKLLLLLAFFSFSAVADIDPKIHPVLRFSPHAETYALSVGNSHLKFVAEDVSFPEGPQKQKFEKALEIMEEVMNSEEFRLKVIGYVRRGERSYQKNFLWNDSSKRLSNEDIYEVIMKGDEKMRPRTEGEMNFNSWVRICSTVQMVTIWCRSVIGSTEPSSSYWIKLNWTFYRNFETHSMVANMVHEWIHLLGFLHGKENLHEEVPYVVGAIAGEVAKNILARESRAPASTLP